MGFSLVVVNGAALLVTQTAHCSGFFCFGAWVLGHAGFSSLWHMGSVVVARRLCSTGSVGAAHGLSCSMECRIFRSGTEPVSQHWQVDSFNEPLGKSGTNELESRK